MSHVEELIAQHCPNGVEFVPLAEVLEPVSNIRWTDALDKEFQYIDLTSVDRVTRTIHETESVTHETAPSRAQQIVRKGDVLFGTTRPTLKRYCVVTREYDGQIASTGFCVLRPIQDRLLTNFLFHLIGTDDFNTFVEANERGASYPAIPDRVVKECRIPVPPLEVQREIVRILDQFTQLEAELEAELEARRVQYAYYRDSLIGNIEGSRCTLGELGTFLRGRRFTKNDIVASGLPCIHYGEIYTGYGVSASRAISEVRSELAGQLRFARTGDVIFAGVGETVEDVGKAVAWLGEDAIAVHDDTFTFTSDLNPKYVAYAVQTADFHAQKVSHVARGKVKRLSASGIAKIKIPVPTRSAQEYLVGVLERFDSLINDIAVGLPAEIAARRKQYEYYCDKLLTFKEAAA